MLRLLIVLLLSLGLSGCELAGDIFQAGLVVGVLVVIVILGVVLWLFKRFRR